VPELSLSPALEKDLPESVGPVLFRKIGGRYLLTGDWGGHCWLEPDEFLKFLRGELEENGPLWNEVRAQGFLRNYLPFESLSSRWRQRTRYLQEGPGLHVASLTRRNSQGSPYVSRPEVDLEDRKFDMTLALARRLIKFVFDAPTSELTIEIRGGDPLLNWDVFAFIVRHSKSFASSVKRKFLPAVVSPLASLDDEQAAFLAEHEVAVAVPFEGPKDLHDAVRPDLAGGSGWERTREGVERLRKAGVEPEAFFTPARAALGRGAEIVAAYREAGFDSIHMRPLWPIGEARSGRTGSVPGAKETLGLYRDILNAALALEAGGTPFREKASALLLVKMLRGVDPGCVEHRLVYGGGLGELAYDFDGDVYPSDEARALSEIEGDKVLRLGSCDLGFEPLVGHSTVRALAVASDLSSQPACSRCAYKPYCGVSPVYNLAAQGSLYGRNPTNDRCAIFMGMFDALFERTRDKKVRPALERWAESAEPGETPPPFLSGGLL
jgi:sulfatase maturation enzyme AslB (radical SAM superfamily)